jgi:hypothetical protein
MLFISDEADFHAHAELQAANATELQLMRHETDMMGHKPTSGKPIFGQTTLDGIDNCRVLGVVSDGIKVLVESGLYEGATGWLTWATLEKSKSALSKK